MNSSQAGEYACDVSSPVDDPDWDAFLESVPDSPHVQSSAWGRLKASEGWCMRRAVVRKSGRIVGGFQLLHRNVSILGGAGYVTRGPVWILDEARLHHFLLEQIIALVRTERLNYVAVQSPRSSAGFAGELRAHGFRLSAFQVAPTATVLVDLAKSEAELHANLRVSLRRTLRQAAARGLTIRTGSAGDLATFHALLAATARRQRFAAPTLDYFRQMWDEFSRHGKIVLFLAEHNREPVAAELDIAFGDTLVSKRAGWSPRHNACSPNGLLVWSAILWAKKNGFGVYDLEGLDPDLAAPLARGESIPSSQRNSRHEFKLGFGGAVVLLPDNYEWIPSPILGSLHRTAWAPFMRSRRIRSWARQAFAWIVSLKRSLQNLGKDKSRKESIP